MTDFWRGRNAVLGTKHQKERVVAPALSEALGITIWVPDDFDTDQFGTFTGDVARTGTQYETLKRKAAEAARRYDTPLAIASEGSFSPHPHVPFVLQNIELVILIDTTHNIEIVGEATQILPSIGRMVSSVAEAVAQAKEWGFPAQGIIVRSSENARDFVKDIDSLEQLETIVHAKLGRFFKRFVFIEQDLRAHKNPTRMRTIATATKHLIEKCKRTCPACAMPGFALQRSISGAPCAACTRATTSPKLHLYECKHCGFRQEQATNISVDPQLCEYCNP